MMKINPRLGLIDCNRWSWQGSKCLFMELPEEELQTQRGLTGELKFRTEHPFRFRNRLQSVRNPTLCKQCSV
jgi:hypothetical protein